MSRIFDVHNHILWGVDDGSKDLQMSIRMLKQAAESGTTDIILTPHNKPNRRNIYLDEIAEMLVELRGVCEKEGININLYPGNEIYYRSDVGERLKCGKAATMAGSRYVLLEYHPMDDWRDIRQSVDEIISLGYYPIIAHVERYANVASDIERAQELIEKGCYLQVNADSIMGECGFGIKRFTRKLLKYDMISFIGSDAHEDKHRVPKLDKCVKYIEKKHGEEMVRKIFETNPLCILEDKYV